MTGVVRGPLLALLYWFGGLEADRADRSMLLCCGAVLEPFAACSWVGGWVGDLRAKIMANALCHACMQAGQAALFSSQRRWYVYTEYVCILVVCLSLGACSLVTPCCLIIVDGVLCCRRSFRWR